VRNLHWAVIGLTFLGGVCGCAPTAKISASPNAVCAGRAVRLSWEGSAAGALTSEPASTDSAGLGDVPASGSKTVHPRTTTTYRFEVGSVLASRAVTTEVRVLEVPKEPVRVAPGRDDDNVVCRGNRMAVAAHVPADAWDKRLRVDLVSSGDGRTYQVVHQVARDEVGPGASAAFRDLPLAGAWTLETELRPGEECGGTEPSSLSIQVSLICAD